MRVLSQRVICITLLITTALFTVSLASRPGLHDSCATYCQKVQSDDSKFKYEVESTYTYTYRGITTTFVNGTSEDKSQLIISATVEMYVASPCEFVLQLRNVKLEESSPGSGSLVIAERNTEFKSALERHPLRFQFNDGEITELCPNNGDNLLSLNVKRGILSTFQNSMKNLYTHATIYEKDVTGICKTHYEVESIEWYKVSIKKTKDLLNCGSRVLDSPASLFSSPSSQKPSPSKTQPLLRSNQECFQSVTHSGIINTAKCHETHLFRPFSNSKDGKSSGLITDVQQLLSFVSVMPRAIPPKTDEYVNIRTNLLYDHNIKRGDSESIVANEENIYSTLDLLHQNSVDGINSKFIPIFSTLVLQLKSLGYPQITKVFSKTNKPNLRKFLLDAMPLVGTADSMTVMRDLFKSNEITAEEIDNWLNSLAFHKNATQEMISAMKPLLDDGFHAKAMLGISSLVYSYCTSSGNVKNCSNQVEVIEVMKRIEQYLGYNCKTSSRVYKEAVIVALKSIGNAGVFTDRVNKLKKCYQEKSNPMDVRLAAISSLRRIPCDSHLRSSILDLYINIEEDTELRIASYITAMQCPSPSIINRIKDTLYNDEVNQVASFVWTHLTNLQETSTSWKKEIKEMLQNDYLQNKFKTDVMKFSRNYEASFFNDDLNAGTSIESNVIFSPESYLPRSATLNLTVDLFGETLNIFELGTRLEGFEEIVEKLFGQDGFFKDDSVLKILQNLMKFKPGDKAKSELNSNNNINNEIMEYSKNFQNSNKLMRKPQGSFYGRVFGNELYFKQFEGLNEIFDYGNGNIDSTRDLGTIMKNILNSNPVDYTKSVDLINADYTVSTIIGLPLRISVNGSATVGLKFNGKSDLKDLFRTASASMALSINPSAAVEITGIMTVDATVTKSGIKSISKLNTNTKNDFKFSMENGNVIELSIDIPKDKMEIIDVSSEMFVLHQSKPVPIEVISNIERWDTCAGERIPTKTGIQLCSKFIFSNTTSLKNSPYFPLTGPFRYALSVEKTDIFSNYYLKFEKGVDDDRFVKSIFFKFDTPGSKLKRKLELFGSLDYLNKVMKLTIDTPVSGNYNSVFKYDDTPSKKGASLSVLHDKMEIINVTAAVLMYSSGRSGWYQPSMMINIYKKLYLDVNGNVNYDHGSKYSSNLVINGITDKPFTLAGDLKMNNVKYNAVVRVQSPTIDIKARGHLKHSPTSVSTKMRFLYSLGSDNKSSQQMIDFSGKVQRHIRRPLLKDKAHVNLQMTAWPQYSTALLWDLHRSNNYFDSRSWLSIGEMKWNTRQFYTNFVSSKYNHRDFAVKFNLACPNKNIDYRAEIQHKVNESDILSYILGQLNAEKRFLGKFNYKTTSELHHEFSIELSDPWKGVSTVGVLDLAQIDLIYGSGSMAYGEHSMQKTLNVFFNHTTTRINNLVKYLLHSVLSQSNPAGELSQIAYTNASYITVYGDEVNSSSLYTYLNFGGEIYFIDLNYTRDIFSHLLLLKSSRPGSELAAKLEVINSLYSKSLSLDINSLRNFSLNVWAQNENTGVDYYNTGISSDLEAPSYYNKIGASFYWDKGYDDTQSILLNIKSNHLSKIAELTVPGQYYRFNFDVSETAMEAKLNWGKNEDTINKCIALQTEWQFELPVIISSVSLTTPFEGFEKQKVAINFNISDSDVLFISNIAWQTSVTNFKFGWNLSKENFIGFTNIESTLTFIEDLTAEINLSRTYEVASEEPLKKSIHDAAAVVFNYNKDKSYFSGDFIKTGSGKNYFGKIASASSYYNNGNEINGSFSFNFDKKAFKFGMNWAENKTVSFSSGINLPMNYYLHLNTPFYFIEKLSINTSAVIKKNNSLFKVDSILNHNSATLDFGNIYNNNTLLTSLFISMTYPAVDLSFTNSINNKNGVVGFKNKFDINAYKTNYLLWKTEGNWFVDFTKKFSFSSILNVPSHNFVLNLSNTENDNGDNQYQLQSTFNIYYNEVYGIEAKFNYDKSHDYKKINFYFITSGFNENGNNIVIDFKHMQEKDLFYKTLLMLPYDYIVKHTLNYNLIDENANKYLMDSIFEIIISENHNTLCKVHNLHTYSINDNYYQFEHKINVIGDGNIKSVIEVSAFYDYLTSDLRRGQLSLTSLWVDPVNITYSLEDHALTSNASKEIKISMNYNKNKNIFVNLKISKSPLIKNITVEIMSPYCKNILFKSLNDFTNDVKVSKNVFVYNENKETTFEFQIKQSIFNPMILMKILNSDNSISYYLNATYNIINWNSSNAFLKTNLFDYKILIDLNHFNDRYLTNHIYNVSAVLMTNIKRYENFNASINFVKDFNNSLPKLINLLLHMNNDHLRFMGFHSYCNSCVEQPIYFNANLVTNKSKVINSYEFSANYSNFNSNDLLKLKYNKNEQVLQFEGLVNRSGELIQSAEFEVEAPYYGYKSVVGKINFPNYNECENSKRFSAVLLQNEEEKIKFNGTINNENGNSIKIAYELSLSCFDYSDRLSGNLEILKSESDYEINLGVYRYEKEFIKIHSIRTNKNDSLTSLLLAGHVNNEYIIDIDFELNENVINVLKINFSSISNSIEFNVSRDLTSTNTTSPNLFKLKYLDYVMLIETGAKNIESGYYSSIVLSLGDYFAVKNISVFGYYSTDNLEGKFYVITDDNTHLNTSFAIDKSYNSFILDVHTSLIDYRLVRISGKYEMNNGKEITGSIDLLIFKKDVIMPTDSYQINATYYENEYFKLDMKLPFNDDDKLFRFQVNYNNLFDNDGYDQRIKILFAKELDELFYISGNLKAEKGHLYEKANVDIAFFIKNWKDVSLKASIINKDDEKYFNVNLKNNESVLKLNTTYLPEFFYFSAIVNHDDYKSKEFLFLSDYSSSEKQIYSVFEIDNNFKLFEFKTKYDLRNELTFESFIVINSEKIFSTNIFADTLFNIETDVFVNYKYADNYSWKFDFRANYNFISEKKIGELYVDLNNQRYNVDGELTLYNGYVDYEFLVNFGSSTSMNESSTFKFSSSYGNGNRLDSIVHFNLNVEIDDETNLNFQFSCESLKKSDFYVKLPPILQTQYLKVLAGNYDFLSDSKQVNIWIYGKVEILQFNLVSVLEDLRGGITFKTLFASNIRHQIDINYDLSIKTNLSTNLILNKIEFQFDLLLDGFKDGSLTLNLPLGDDNFKLLFTYDFVNETKSINGKLNSNSYNYIFNNSISYVGPANVLNIYTETPYFSALVHGEYNWKLTENSSSLVFNVIHNGIKQFDLLLNFAECNSNQNIKSIKLLIDFPFANSLNVQSKISIEKYRTFDFLITFSYTKSNKNVIKQLRTGITCQNNDSCNAGESYFGIIGLFKDPVSFKLQHNLSGEILKINGTWVEKMLNVYGEYSTESDSMVEGTNLIVSLSDLKTNTSLFLINGDTVSDNISNNYAGRLVFQLADKKYINMYVESKILLHDDKKDLKESNERLFIMKLTSFNGNEIHLNETLKLVRNYDNQEIYAEINSPIFSVEQVNVFAKLNSSYTKVNVLIGNSEIITSHFLWNISSNSVYFDASIDVKQSDLNYYLKYINGKTMLKMKFDNKHSDDSFIFESPIKYLAKVNYNFNYFLKDSLYNFISLNFNLKSNGFNNGFNSSILIADWNNYKINTIFVFKNLTYLVIDSNSEILGLSKSSTVLKLYPNYNYGYIFKISGDFSRYDPSNYINNIGNYDGLVLHCFVEVNKESRVGEKNIEQIFMLNLNSTLIGTTDQDYRKNLTVFIDMNSNGNSVLLLETRFNRDYLLTANEHVNNFFMSVYPNASDRLKNYTLSLYLKTVEEKISSERVYSSSLNSVIDLLFLFSFDNFSCDLEFLSPNIDKKYQFGYVKQSNYTDDKYFSRMNRFFMFLNANTAALSYDFSDISYVSHIDFLIPDYFNLNGSVKFEGSLLPVFQHSLIYDINNKSGNISLRSIRDENVINNTLHVQSDSKILKFNINMDANDINPFVEIFCTRNNDSNGGESIYSIRITFENEDDLMNKLVLIMRSPYINDRTVSVMFNKHVSFGNVFLNINSDESPILTLQKDETSGSLFVTFYDEEINLKYELKFKTDDIYKIVTEARLFSWVINSNVDKLQEDLKVKLEYFKDDHYSNKNEFLLSIINNQMLLINCNLFYPNDEDGVANGVSYFTDDKYSFKVILNNDVDNIDGRFHWEKNYLYNTLTFKHNKKFPLHSELSFTNLEKTLKLLFTYNATHIVSFIGDTDDSLGQFLSFEGAYLIDNHRVECLINLKTPFVYATKSFHFNSLVGKTDSIELYIFDLYYITENYKGFNGIKSRAKVSERNDLSGDVTIRTPFKNYENFDVSAVISVPSNLLVNGFINTRLPSNKNYRLVFDFNKSEHHIYSFDLSSKLYCWNETLQSSEKIDFDIIENSLFEIKNSFSINSRLNSEDNSLAYLFGVNWNELSIADLSYFLNFNANTANLKWSLNTILSGHKKYELEINVESSETKMVKVQLTMPKFIGNDFVFDISYKYHNVTNNYVKLIINVPYCTTLQNVKFDMKNVINVNNKVVLSALSISYKKRFSFGYKISLEMFKNVIKTDAVFQLNDEKLGFELANVKNLDADNILFSVSTPFKTFEQAKINISFTKNVFSGSSFVTEFNYIEIFSLNFLEKEDNVNTLKVKFYEHFFIIENLYDRNSGLHVYCKVGWQNSVGGVASYIKGDINFSKLARHKNYILLQTVLPSIQRNTSFEMYYLNHYEEGMEYFCKLSLDNNTNFGFVLSRFEVKNVVETSQLKRTSYISNELQLILPYQVIVINREDENYENVFGKYFSLQWGKSENMKKIIGGGFKIEKSYNGLIVRKVRINHFSLSKDLEFSLTTDDNRIALEMLDLNESTGNKFSAEIKRWWVLNDSTVGVYESSDYSSVASGVDLSVSYPRSNLFYRFSSNYTFSSDSNDLGLTFEYINYDNIFKYASIVGKFILPTKELSLIVDTNRNKIHMSGLVWSKDNGYKGLTISSAINNIEPLKVDVGVNSENPEIEIELDYGVSKSYHLYTGLPNDHVLKAEISHSIFGSLTNDLLTMLQLNTSRLLWGCIKYSPDIYNDFTDTVVHDFDHYSKVVNEVINSVYDIASDENIFVKPYKLYDNFLSSAGLIIDETFVEFESVFPYCDDLLVTFEKKFDENQYYIKDIYKFFRSGVLHLGDKIIFCVQTAANVNKVVFESFFNLYNHILKTIQLDKLKIKQFGTDIKLILHKFIDSGKQMMGYLHLLRGNIHRDFKDAIEVVRLNLRSLVKELFLNYLKLELTFHDFYATAVYNYRLQINKLFSFMNRIVVFVDVVEGSIFELLESVRQNLLTISELKSLIALCSEYSDSFRDLKLNNYIEEFKVFIEKVLQLITDDVHRNFYEYKIYLNVISDVIIGNYDTIVKSPVGNYIKEICNRIYYKTKWFWHYSEMSGRLKNTVYQLFIDTDKILERFINNIEKMAPKNNHELATSLSVSPDRTYVEFSQELPVDWYSFNRFPNIHQFSNYAYESSSANDPAALDKYKNYFYDAVSYYTGNGLSLTNVIPEFGSRAMIGGNHYVTFDGVIYDFDSGRSHNSDSCLSYVLTGDLLHNKFTVIINYINKGDGEFKKNSLTVLTEGHTINFGLFSKLLTINGKETEMPKFIGDSLVIRRDINNIILHSKHGIDIDCSLEYDLCVFKLSGWNFGKTGGLLGTYNNEPVDDFSYANGTITQSIDEFADSWIAHLNGECSGHVDRGRMNLVANYQKFENKGFKEFFQILKINDNDICKSYFSNRSSIFASCFHVVNPEPYLHTCNSDMSTAAVDADLFITLCTNAALYVSQCKNHGVSLPMPSACDRCDTMGSSLALQHGDTLYFNMNSLPPPSSDVVFIIEQASCVNKVKLPDVIGKLDGALFHNGIKNNRFAIITYDSQNLESNIKDNQPYINTIDGDVWTSKIKSIEKAFKRGLYSPSNRILPVNPDKSLYQDYPPAYRALKFATRLKFRPGVSKTIILIVCDKCSDKFVKPSYLDMIQTMLDADITLHILQHRAIEGLSSKSSKVFGVDINGAYTGRNIKSLTPSAPLLKQVALPKDLCSTVALETNGTLFSLDRISKKFMDVWVRRIAQTATPSTCQECSCLRMTDGSSTLMCHKCLKEETQEVVTEQDIINERDYIVPVDDDSEVSNYEYDIILDDEYDT